MVDGFIDTVTNVWQAHVTAIVVWGIIYTVIAIFNRKGGDTKQW